MKLTKQTLKRIIKEELETVIDEINIGPKPPEAIPDNNLRKIHDLIDSGKLDQAQIFIDSLGGPTDYVEKYIKNQEVGDLEKLGNESGDMDPYTYIASRSYREQLRIAQLANKLARDKSNSTVANPNLEAYESEIERFDSSEQARLDQRKREK